MENNFDFKDRKDTKDLDSLNTEEILKILQEEDKKISYAVERELNSIVKAADLCVSSIHQGGRIFYVGAGTSGRLGVLDAVDSSSYFGYDREIIIPVIAGGHDALAKSVPEAQDNKQGALEEFKKHSLGELDIVIGISSSGETPYVVGALEYAKKHGVKTICVTNTVDSEITQNADIPISIIVGPETIAGSTRLKSATSVKMVLNMLSTCAIIKSGKIFGNIFLDHHDNNRRAKERRIKAIMDLSGKNREEALMLLKESDGDQKTAVLMGMTQLSCEQCRNLLNKFSGNLKDTLNFLKR